MTVAPRVGGLLNHTTPAQPQSLVRWPPNFTGIMTDRNDRDLVQYVALTTICAVLPAQLVTEFPSLAKDP